MSVDAFGNALGSSLTSASTGVQAQGQGPWSSRDYVNGSDLQSDNYNPASAYDYRNEMDRASDAFMPAMAYDYRNGSDMQSDLAYDARRQQEWIGQSDRIQEHRLKDATQAKGQQMLEAMRDADIDAAAQRATVRNAARQPTQDGVSQVSGITAQDVLGYAQSYPALAREVDALTGAVKNGHLSPAQAQAALLNSPRANSSLRNDYINPEGVSPTSSSPGAYLSPATGDRRSPMQRFLDTSAPLYSSPLGAANYALGKTIFGLSEENARLAGALGSVTESLGSVALSKSRLIQPVGNEKFNPTVDSFINIGKQDRHLFGTSANTAKGGGYFRDASDAQDVLNAYQRGEATVLGQGSDGGHIVRFNGVTGYNNNASAGYFDQPTNTFWIKGAASVSVVPKEPTWSSKK